MGRYHEYCTKKIKASSDDKTEGDDHQIIKKIISNLDEILMIYLQNEYTFLINGMSSSPDKRDDYHLRRDGRENLCLNIMRDILKIHKGKYCNDIYKSLKFAIEKK